MEKSNIITQLIFILTFLLLIQIEFCFSKGNDSIIYKNISSIYYSYQPELSLAEDSLYFNGYLIFKISQLPNKGIYLTSDKTYMCDIYWIYSLENLEIKSEHFNYISTLQFIVSGELAYFNEKETENTKNDIELRNFFYQYDSSRSSAFLKKRLNTSLFSDSTVFWNYQNTNSVGYFIFKNSFDAALLRTTLTYLDEETKEEGRIKNSKILVPISEAYTFEPVPNEYLLKNGFRKSKWFPKDLTK